MDYNDLKREYERIEESILNINKKIEMLRFISFNVILNNTEVGEEELCRYDCSMLWEEYSFFVTKSIYYTYEYINNLQKTIKKLLEVIDINKENNVVIPTKNSCDIIPTIYSFDAMIISISSLIDGDWKNIFGKYINQKKVLDIFPNNKNINLFWELNIIRNRIVHPTLSRYNCKDGECRQFIYFSTFPNNLNVTNGNLSMKCRIPDMYSSDIVKDAVKKAIDMSQNKQENDKNVNVIDLLFPEKAAIGKNKKNPTLIMYDDSINYDHICSSIKLINETLDFIDKIINLFFEELIKKIEIDKILKETYVVIINETEYKLKIIDVFEYYFK